MGKGSRNREVRIAENQASANGGIKLSKKQLIKQQEKKEKLKRTITMVASLVILVAVVVGVVVVALNKAPKLEGNISATSDKYEIDNAMMAYFMYSQYSTFVNNNYYYLSYYGLDTSTSLKAQKMTGSDTTWFTYFLRAAQSQVNELVALASEAQAKGVSLDEDELKEIDDAIASMKAEAKTHGYGSINKYLAAVYVTGVTENAVRKAWELQELAAKYYEQIYESFTYTDEEMEEYRDENPSSFYKFDYVFYEFDPEYDKNATEAEKKTALEEAKKKAENFLAEATDETAFKNLIVDLEKAAEEEAAATATGTSAAATGTGDTEKSDEDYLKNYIKEGSYYTEDDPFFEWAFEEDRKAGEIKLIEVTETDDDDKETVVGYAVYCLTKTAYLDEYATKDVRHILFTKSTYGTDDAAKKKAEEVLTLFNAGDKTEEAFGELAKEYTEDSNGDKGGIYENVPKDYMVTEFNDWMYDEDRKVGDTEIVKTSYGYHIMYHVGDGEVAWKVTAEESLKAEEYEEYIEALEKTYPVTYDAAKLATIP